MIDPQFRDAIANTLRISKKPNLNARDSPFDGFDCDRISQARQPVSELDRLTNLEHGVKLAGRR